LYAVASEYRAMVADLASTLTGVSVRRARAEIRNLAGGEKRVEETKHGVELWSPQTAGQALMRVAGGPQQMTYPAHS
jgi:hypothetical protein